MQEKEPKVANSVTKHVEKGYAEKVYKVPKLILEKKPITAKIVQSTTPVGPKLTKKKRISSIKDEKELIKLASNKYGYNILENVKTSKLRTTNEDIVENPTNSKEDKNPKRRGRKCEYSKCNFIAFNLAMQKMHCKNMHNEDSDIEVIATPGSRLFGANPHAKYLTKLEGNYPGETPK